MFAPAAVFKLVKVLCYCGSALLPIVEAWKLHPKLRHHDVQNCFRLQCGGRKESKSECTEEQRQCTGCTVSSTTETPYPAIMMNRRSMARLGLVALSPFVNLNKKANAEEEEEQQDLTNQLYNPDGSLKISKDFGVQTTLVSIDFPNSEGEPIIGTEYARQVSIDGTLQHTTLPTAHATRAIYQIPTKWTNPTGANRNGYYNTLAASSSYTKACDRIIVYQQYVGEQATKNNLLVGASTVGISKTLQLEDSNSEWRIADLLSARRIDKPGDYDLTYKYYFYDLAIAPKTCDTVSKTSENLGLGFCPYDRIALISAVLLNQYLYVFQLECTKDEWKCCNSDLKRIRESFCISASATKPRKPTI